jgi:protein-L-isoaspartate(D-aspartate) O-methyltransferase
MTALTAVLGGAALFALLGMAAGPASPGDGPGKDAPARDGMAEARRRMVETQIAARGVKDPAVLAAMRRVPRHRFVDESARELAHSDGPLPIGAGQTISQPYIVAIMTELARPTRAARVLEIGTGSGYQAAVLAECFGEVYTIEIVPELGRRAEALLRELGYANVFPRIGDGYDGWPAKAPFDAIVVTAAPDTIPKPLLEQLKPGGRLVAPVGTSQQELVVVTRTDQGFVRESIIPVRFVPMTGKALKD